MLTDSEEIRHLNQQFRRINEVTDVLSFPALQMIEETGRAGAGLGYRSYR